MKKKSKFLLCLISTIVLSLALPCLGSSVSALTLTPGVKTLKGEKLLQFLTDYYYVSVQASDTPDFSNPIELSRVDYEYQLVYDDVGDNVYLTFQFPTVNGVVPIVKNKYYRIWFRSVPVDPDEYIQLVITSFNTTIYKRYVVSNGDVTDGDTEPILDFEMSLSGMDSPKRYSVNVEGVQKVDFEFPFMNQGIASFNNGSITVNPWISTLQPYRKFNDGTYQTEAQSAAPLTVDFNSARDTGQVSSGLYDFAIIYSSGNRYRSSAVQFAITPITLGVVRSLEQQLFEPQHPEITDQQVADSNLLQHSVGLSSDALGTSSSDITNGVYLPWFDLERIIKLTDQNDISEGLKSYQRATAVLFGNTTDNPNMMFMLAPAVPALLVSYLLFGKKG